MSVGKSIAAFIVFSILYPTLTFSDSILTTNGSFETGDFIGWQTLGDTLVVNSTFGVTPPTGSFQALMSTAPNIDLAPPNPGYPLQSGTFSSNHSIGASTSFPGGLAAFVGLTEGSLANLCGLGCTPFQGSAIKQSFTGSAGDILSFNFDFLSNEGGDFGFVAVDGTVDLLKPAINTCTTYPLAPSPYISGSTLSPTGFQNECGYRSFGTTLTSTGTHNIAIGVVDIEDNLYTSVILLDDVQLTSAPEPSTWLLLASGLVGIVFLKRRVTRTSHRSACSRISKT